MITVLRHGNTISVQNPVTLEWNNLINVTFVEYGRAGADKGMSETSAFLSNITGEAVGLNQLRTHTHPVLIDKIGLFPIGQEFPGHINRGMFSTPQIRQQADKDPRWIDGRPTYFKTWISERPEEDVDQRISNEVLISQMGPQRPFASTVGAANVRVIETRREGVQGSNSNTDVQGATYSPASVLNTAMNRQQTNQASAPLQEQQPQQ